MDIKDYIVNKDYGRRLYVPRDAKRKPYARQMRSITDKSVNNNVRYPHSESKKPYREDEYPFMEYAWTPFDFNWPDFPLPEFPDIPWIIPHPEIPGEVINPPDKPDPVSEFLGCFFYVPLTPNSLEEGETAYAKLQRRDDPIVRFEVHGPADVISENAINCHHGYDGGPSSPECTVIIKVKDSTEGYAESPGGGIPIVLIAFTASGQSCSTSATVDVCPADPPLAYDWDNSDETLTASDTGATCVTGGRPPFSWAVTGEDVTLAAETTTDRCNTVISGASFCGSATITITDDCGDQVTGSMRHPGSGMWWETSLHTCVVGIGPATGPSNERVVGKYRVVQNVRTAYSNANLVDEDCTLACPAACFCHGQCDGNAPCQTEAMGGCEECIDYPYWPCADGGGGSVNCLCNEAFTVYVWVCT